MALVRARVDLSLFQLMGRWKSDVMPRYLHRSALQTVDLAALMLQHDEFIIPRHQTLPTLPEDQQLLVDTTDPTVLDPAVVPTQLFAKLPLQPGWFLPLAKSHPCFHVDIFPIIHPSYLPSVGI